MHGFFPLLFQSVNSDRKSKSAECPKLIKKKILRKSIERQHYTPIRLDKKFEETFKMDFEAKGTKLVDKFNQPQ